MSFYSIVTLFSVDVKPTSASAFVLNVTFRLLLPYWKTVPVPIFLSSYPEMLTRPPGWLTPR